jgi:hypothetical protein
MLGRFSRASSRRPPSAVPDRQHQTALATYDTLPTMVLERVEAWPPEVQNQLAEFALELDAGARKSRAVPLACRESQWHEPCMG